MKKFLGCLLITVFVFSGSIAYGEVVNMPDKEAYEKAIDYVLDLGFIPAMENEKRRLFKTEKLTIKLTSKECDCGRMFGIPYMKDKRTTTDAIYQVRVKKIDEETSDITIKVTIEGYYVEKKSKIAAVFADKHRNRDKLLDCTSTGVLEQRMLEAINKM